MIQREEKFRQKTIFRTVARFLNDLTDKNKRIFCYFPSDSTCRLSIEHQARDSRPTLQNVLNLNNINYVQYIHLDNRLIVTYLVIR